MTKQFLVTAIQKTRVTYRVPANSEEEATNKIENPDRTFEILQEEYEDLDSIVHVEEDI